MRTCMLFVLCMLALIVAGSAFAAGLSQPTYSVRLTITSELPCPKIPMDPMIDFTSLIRQKPCWPGVGRLARRVQHGGATPIHS